MEQHKSLIITLIVVIVIAIGGAVLYSIGGLPSFTGGLGPASRTPDPTPRVVEETLVIPETEKITGTEGRVVSEGSVDVALVPKNEGEKVIVAKAILTIKGSYEMALPLATVWAGDSKLVFIKSLGTITLEGKSSQWQIAFSAKSKPQKGYEIIIQGDKAVSKKEIDSTAVGADLPKVWKDLGDVIKELQSHPLYQDATVSAATFYLNSDNKKWYYTLSTSKGVSSIVIE